MAPAEIKRKVKRLTQFGTGYTEDTNSQILLVELQSFQNLNSTMFLDPIVTEICG